MASTPTEPETLRTAEVVASVCLATDLGMHFPFEHGFQGTLMALRLCDILGLDDDIRSQVYYGSMLMYCGCNVDAALGKPILGGNIAETLVPHLFGSTTERASGLLRSLPPSEGSTLGRAVETARRFPRLIANSQEQQTSICEVAEMMTRRLGLPAEIGGIFTFVTDRWDGKGMLRRAEGDEIPLAVRIFVLSRDAAFQLHIGGYDHAIGTIRERAGHAFDPALAKTLLDHFDDVLRATDVEASTWSSIVSAEPKPWRFLAGQSIDQALAAIGDLADLISPFLSGHSGGLADLAATAADCAGMSAKEALEVRRAAHVHDVGRVAIDPNIWRKTAALSRDDYEQIRLHPYHTERVLNQASFLKSLAGIARDHHEHLDGSGYHRGVSGQSLSPSARLLAAADTFKAMTEPRPHRPALTPSDAAKELVRLADSGRLDHAAVAAVIEAAGQPVPEMERPAGLTEREAEVIGLLARGLQTKQIATALGISPKTADTHIQAGYRKMGVSTRASAALYAMEHGLVPSGELPISD